MRLGLAVRSMSRFWSWARTCGDGRSLFHVLEPYPGALAGLDSLVAAGHDVVIVTTKPNFAIRDTHEWLVRHEIPAVEVHIVDDKAAVDCDLYVDDAMRNLQSYRDRRPDGLPHQPRLELPASGGQPAPGQGAHAPSSGQGPRRWNPPSPGVAEGPLALCALHLWNLDGACVIGMATQVIG